jgi:hypothetical protein
MFKAAALGFLLGTALGLAGCSNDAATKADGNGGMMSFCDLPPECQQISQACMPKDIGAPGQVHDCHMEGMEKGVRADCQRDLASCLKACTEAPALGDGAVEDLSAGCRD